MDLDPLMKPARNPGAARPRHHRRAALRAVPVRGGGAHRWAVVGRIHAGGDSRRAREYAGADDGAEELREFEMEAEVVECRVAFVVSAAEFGRMGWVLSRLGPQTIVYPGGRLTDRATPGDLVLPETEPIFQT